MNLQKLSPFLTSLLILGATMSCFADQKTEPSFIASGRTIGSLRGLASISQHLATKLLDPMDDNSAQFELQSVAGEEIVKVSYILGGFVTVTDRNEYQGGELNPFSLLVWQRLIDEFAFSFGQVCRQEDRSRLVFAQGQVFRLRPELVPTVTNLCQRIDRSDLENLWIDYVGFGAEEEMKAWVDYFSSSYSEPGEERLTALVWTIMMNPRFFLES